MTGGRFPEVDDDLLADYVGGALDGRPEHATVAALIDEEPAWAQAYTRLAAGMARVGADLADLGGVELTMPSAVTDRITAALRAAGQPDVDTTDGVDAVHAVDGAPGVDGAVPAVRAEVPAQPRSGTERHTTATSATIGSVTTAGTGSAGSGSPAGPGTASGSSRSAAAGSVGPGNRPDRRATGRDSRRRRWARWAAPVTVAAVAVAVAGVGLGQLANPSGVQDSGGSASDESAPRAEAAPTALLAPADVPRRSGTDYSPQMLRESIAKQALTPAPAPAKSDEPDALPGAEGATEGPRIRVQTGLDRLTARPALDTCLAEIAREHDRGPLTVDVVDYASFQGRPALVVGFDDGSGARWAWVTGPECGVPGSGADTRYRAQVR